MMMENGNMRTVLLIMTVVLLNIYLLGSCIITSYFTDEVTIGEATPVTLEAVGVEFDPHFFSQNLTRNDGAKSADWELIVRRVRSMELQKFRVMVLPEWYEPVNDNEDPNVTDWDKFTFRSQEMHSLYKVLDLAQELEIEVCIVLWGCPVYVSLLDQEYEYVKTNFMADPDKEGVWITGPTDYEEWAENFYVLIKHLIYDRKYTCVTEITPLNEPDGGPLLTSDEYIKMVKVLDSRFKKEGIRNLVKFNLSDNTDTRTFYLKECAEHLREEADLFNSHTYIFGYDTPNETIFNWERNNVKIAASAGKRHLVGEFGSNQTIGSSRQRDINRYERGVLMTRLTLNFLNAGAAGVSYWSLLDQYYGRDADYEQMQQLGLWKYVKEAYHSDSIYHKIKEDYEVRPQFHAYSLLSRFVKPGSKIHPIDLQDDFALGTAFYKDGKWTYVFVNDTDVEKSLSVVNPSVTGDFEFYRYEEKSLPDDDRMIMPTGFGKTKNGKLFIDIAPHSVLLCRQQ